MRSWASLCTLALSGLSLFLSSFLPVFLFYSFLSHISVGISGIALWSLFSAPLLETRLQPSQILLGQNLVDFGWFHLQLLLPAKHSECLQKHLYTPQTVCLLLVIWYLFSFSDHVFKHPNPIVKNRKQQLPVTGMIKNFSSLIFQENIYLGD